MTEDIVGDGLVVLAVEAAEERGGGGGRDSTLAAQALQGLRVEASPHASSSCSRAVGAGAFRAFRDLARMSPGPIEVQKVVGHTDVVAEGRPEKWDKRNQTIGLSVAEKACVILYFTS